MKKALLIVDMLNDFIKPDGKLYCGKQAEEIVPFIKEKISEFRKENHTIVFVCDRHEAEDAEFHRFPPHCIEGSPGADVVDELTYDGCENHMTGKQRYSGFFNTDLDEQLEEAEEVTIAGVCTNICVFFTAEELCNRDKKVVVYEKGVASFDLEAHAFALRQMQSVLGVEVR